MTLVRVAVPVLQGRRRFHYDKTRPWSVLEHMLLFEIGERPTTAAALAERAHLPLRIIVEALIRLMHASWVEMTQQANGVFFQITPEGLVYREYENLPTAPRRLSRIMNFVVDQITGSVFRTRDLPFLHEHIVQERAQQERIVWIERPTIRLQEGVRPLIEALFQDDERFIAIDAYGDRLAERWSLVSVRDGQPDGLTPRAPPALVEAIVAAANVEGAILEEKANVIPTIAVQPLISGYSIHPDHQISFSASDLIAGGPEHREALLSALRKARYRVIIHSTFIAEDRFNDLLHELRKAISKGVTIDILWGQNEESDKRRSTARVVAKLRAAIQEERLENLIVHP
jgi:cardiolipin synthase